MLESRPAAAGFHRTALGLLDPHQSVAGWLRDSTVFKAEFDSAGTNQTLWVHDYTLGIESYRCLVDVAQRTESILIVGPDTIRAGATVVYQGNAA